MDLASEYTRILMFSPNFGYSTWNLSTLPSASQTFGQEIYEKEMHLVFLQILSLVNECQIHNKCGIVSNHPPHRAQCDEAIDLF